MPPYWCEGPIFTTQKSRTHTAGASSFLSPPANAGELRDVGLILGSGRSVGGGHGAHSSILAWRIPWTEEPGGLQSIALQRVGHN